jgi:F-type H+-transporting ATPase subunit b
MDMILTIFKSLGVDQTVFIQFFTLIVLFIILSNTFFSRLKEVLDLRESKTTKLESNAHAVYKQADELAEQYKANIEKKHQESHLNSQKKKSEILNTEKDLLKQAEEKLTAEYESKKASLLKEFADKKEVAMKSVDTLATNLVEKITKQ